MSCTYNISCVDGNTLDKSQSVTHIPKDIQHRLGILRGRLLEDVPGYEMSTSLTLSYTNLQNRLNVFTIHHPKGRK